MNSARILASVLWAGAVLVKGQGLRLIVRGARAAGHPDQSRLVVKGFRRMILGGGLICFGLGSWLDVTALHVVGVVFLAEEAVETQIMTWALRRQRRRSEARPPGKGTDSC